MREIKESDWIILQRLHSVALERFSQQILAEVEGLVSGDAKSAHQRYLDIDDLPHQCDQEMAQAFNDLRRSTALTQLALMKARGLLTEDELSQLSEGTQKVILGERVARDSLLFFVFPVEAPQPNS